MQKLKLKKEYQKYSEYKPAHNASHSDASGDSGISYLDKIPKNWEARRMKFCIGKMESGSRENVDKNVLEDTVPSIGGEHIVDGKIKFKENKYITQEYYNSLHKGKIKSGDILLVKDGATIGKMGIAQDFVGKMAVNEHVYLLRANNETEQKFLYYLLISPEIQSLISLETRGSAQGGLNTTFTSNIFNTFPPKKEQKKIDKFLDDKVELIDEIVKKKKKLIELLKEKRTAIINQAVTKGLDSNVEMKYSGVEWIGKIPNNWKVQKLKFFGNAIIGLTYSPDDIADESGTLVLRSSNIQNGKIKLEDNVYVNKKISNKLTTKKGDILICSRNGSRKLIGKNACIDEISEGLSFGAFMTIFRTKHWQFISYFLKSNVFMSQLSTTLTSTINQLTINNLNNIVAAIPSDTEQEKITEYLKGETEKIDIIMKKVEKSINLLNEFKSSLISNVVTGKIRV